MRINQKGEIDVALLIISVSIFFIIAAMAIGCVIGAKRFVKWNNQHQNERGRGDAPTGNIDIAKRQVYQMPDAFSNVATFCDAYGNSVYVTTKSDESRAMFALKDGCRKD